MFKSLQFFLFFVLLILGSCRQKLPYGNPVIDPEIALKEQNFSGYWRLFLNLSPDFTGLDSSGIQISKATFLKQVGTGNYFPLRLASDSGTFYYKLHPIKKPISEFVRLTLMGLGNETYKHYMWEGKNLPEIQFTDLNGNVYNNANMKGKTVMIDFWFIGCTACVQEFPKLNKLADSIGNREVVFLSIAFDQAKELRKFLNKTELRFEVVSDTSYLLNKALEVHSYPTQVLVDKEGRIVKILDDPYHRWENIMATFKDRKQAF